MNQSERPRIEPLTRDALPAAVWSVEVAVRFGHCDPAGIVFTPRYFDMLNEVIERFFVTALQIDYYALLTTRRIGLGYVQASCEFLKPSRMGDLLDIAVLVERIGRGSYTLVLPILKGGTEVARGRLITVPTLLDSAEACPIPADIRVALEAYRERCGDGVAI